MEGIKHWWAHASGGMKALVIVGGGVLVYLLYRWYSNAQSNAAANANAAALQPAGTGITGAAVGYGQGAPGGVGPAGPAGPTGATGLTGATGAAGATGATGPAGATGLTGAAGTPGPQGIQGLAGAPGASGGTVTAPSTYTAPPPSYGGGGGLTNPSAGPGGFLGYFNGLPQWAPGTPGIPNPPSIPSPVTPVLPPATAQQTMAATLNTYVPGLSQAPGSHGFAGKHGTTP